MRSSGNCASGRPGCVWGACWSSGRGRRPDSGRPAGTFRISRGPPMSNSTETWPRWGGGCWMPVDSAQASNRHGACMMSERTRELGEHDLVLVGYVLGELSESARESLVDAAWNMTVAALVIVEPGTPAGAARVQRARGRLIERGADVAAPCPHAGVVSAPVRRLVPLRRARSIRSSLQRRLKRGSLAYEDEKYSYVAVVRGSAERCAARVLRRPRRRAPPRVASGSARADGLRRGARDAP